MRQDTCERCGEPTPHVAHATVEECLAALAAELHATFAKVDSLNRRIGQLLGSPS